MKMIYAFLIAIIPFMENLVGEKNIDCKISYYNKILYFPACWCTLIFSGMRAKMREWDVCSLSVQK